MIRNYKEQDIIEIEKLGKELNPNYKYIFNSQYKILILEELEKIIGFIIYTIVEDEIEIIDLVVNKNYRQQGKATLLLNEVLKKESICKKMTLEVRESNFSAIKFYDKHGFKVVNIRKKYYFDEENALLMVKMVN